MDNTPTSTPSTNNTPSTPTNNTAALKERVVNVFDATESIISKMKLGDRTNIKALSTQVGTILGLMPLQVLPYVNDFCHSTSLAYVSPGKYGGVIRSDTGKPLKGTKTSPLMKAAELNKDTEIDADNEE